MERRALQTLGKILALSVILMVAHIAHSQDSAPAEKQFLYKLQLTRADMLKTGPTKEESDAVERHYNRLVDYTKKGVVILAGRTLTTDENTFGIVIFRAETEDAAREFMNGDPAVQKGVMKATLFPFQVALAEGKAVY